MPHFAVSKPKEILSLSTGDHFDPLGRGIDVHTPLNYEILDCKDFGL